MHRYKRVRFGPSVLKAHDCLPFGNDRCIVSDGINMYLIACNHLVDYQLHLFVYDESGQIIYEATDRSKIISSHEFIIRKHGDEIFVIGKAFPEDVKISKNVRTLPIKGYYHFPEWCLERKLFETILICDSDGVENIFGTIDVRDELTITRPLSFQNTGKCVRHKFGGYLGIMFNFKNLYVASDDSIDVISMASGLVVNQIKIPAGIWCGLDNGYAMIPDGDGTYIKKLDDDSSARFVPVITSCVAIVDGMIEKESVSCHSNFVSTHEGKAKYFFREGNGIVVDLHRYKWEPSHFPFMTEPDQECIIATMCAFRCMNLSKEIAYMIINISYYPVFFLNRNNKKITFGSKQMMVFDRYLDHVANECRTVISVIAKDKIQYTNTHVIVDTFRSSASRFHDYGAMSRV